MCLRAIASFYVVTLPFLHPDMTLQWRVWNNGSLTAIGYKCDAAYLSQDSKWDIADHQLGRPVCTFISISPANPETEFSMQPRGPIFSATRMTPFVAQTNYSCILSTRTNIRDPNLANNIGVSATPVRVNAPTLSLAAKTNISIASGSELVYKIENVPSERTLIATLIAPESSRFHDIFLRYRNPPTSSTYDAFSVYTLSYNQTAIVQSTKPGTYYIRIDNFSQNTETYEVEVEVKIATFEITDITPTSAAPHGYVTLSIAGTLLSNEIEATLINEATSTVVTASAVYWFSSVEIYATFNISNVSIGIYTVKLTNMKTTQYAVLRNSFHISSGIPGQISTRIDAPQNLLRRDSTIVTLLVQNTGNTDICTPIMFARSNRNVQISIIDGSGQEEDNYAPELVFLPVPLQGPSGIIPPGVTTKTLFRILPNSFRASFSDTLYVSFLDEKQLDLVHSYVDRKQELKPQDIPNDSWDIIWNNFLSSVGETWRTMTEQFSDIANELSTARIKIESVDELVDFQLHVAQGDHSPLGKVQYEYGSNTQRKGPWGQCILPWTHIGDGLIFCDQHCTIFLQKRAHCTCLPPPVLP